MKPFQFVALILITSSFAISLSNLRKAYSEEFTTAVMTTEEGTQVHQKIGDSQYGQAIDGDFMIQAPSGKCIDTANVQEWLLLQISLLGAGLLFLIISFRINRKNS
jgi:hypothetical protein